MNDHSLQIEIDGKPVAVTAGSTIIEAAHQAGTYIPHFCYHKKLSVAANCRMCLVEVEKSNKPQPACATLPPFAKLKTVLPLKLNGYLDHKHQSSMYRLILSIHLW